MPGCGELAVAGEEVHSVHLEIVDNASKSDSDHPSMHVEDDGVQITVVKL